jgi:hypothetical protein
LVHTSARNDNITKKSSSPQHHHYQNRMSQQQQQQQPKRLDGKVKAVLSGDTLVLSHPTKLFPAIEKTLTLVRIQAPRMAKRNEPKEDVSYLKCIYVCVKTN